MIIEQLIKKLESMPDKKGNVLICVSAFELGNITELTPYLNGDVVISFKKHSIRPTED
jgi:hypothetical protein